MKVLLIANPLSGKYSAKKISKIMDILNKKFNNIDLYLTKYRGDAKRIASETQSDIVIATGGDGLINEVVSGLYGREDKYFAALPLGTANIFCHEYGIDADPIRAAEKLNLDKVINIPVGFIDDKLFLLMVGFGFDSAVVSKVEDDEWYDLKYKFKKFLYLILTMKIMLKNKFDNIEISAKGYDHNIAHLIVSIVSSYGGSYKLGKLEHGKLNLFAIFKSKRLDLFKSLTSLFILKKGFVGSRMNVDYLKINNAKNCQIDGEFHKIDKQSVFLMIKQDAIKFVF